MSAKPWLKLYDPQVPSSLMPYPSQPVHQFLADTARRVPNDPVTLTSAHLPVVGRQKSTLSFSQLDAQSDALAAALVSLGVKKGDRVAIVMVNCVQFIIAYYAILKVGAIVCATNPTYPVPRMQHQLKDCGANTAIVMSLFYNTVKQAQPGTDIKNVIVTNIKEYLPPLAATLFTLAKEKKGGHRIEKAAADHEFQDLLKRFAGQKATVQVEPDDAAIFQYTGGTTGVSKAAIGTHRALVANTLQCKAWLANTEGSREVLLAAIPLFHVFGMVSVMNYSVGVGACMLLVANPREIGEVLAVINTYKPTLFNGVPAMYNAINVNPDVVAGKYDLSSIRVCVSGSAPLPPATKREFERLTGGKLLEGWGMSETPTAAIINPVFGQARLGAIGLPISDTDARIVSLEDGVTDLPPGEIGELVVCGPQLMKGYYNMPTETANALRQGPDGQKWLYTGDIARMDEDGYFYIVDRKKDMAIIGGFNVYPTNVEKVLAEHPAVQEAGVAAIQHPDKPGQEALKAWVILKPGMSASSDELVQFCADRLARYEVPTRIEFVKELPRTTVGKVLRRELVQAEMSKAEQKTT